MQDTQVLPVFSTHKTGVPWKFHDNGKALILLAETLAVSLSGEYHP